MKPFELRLAQEHLQSSRRLKNLDAFIGDKSRFERLPVEHQNLMLEQAEHLARYVRVLEKRLKILGIPV